MRIELSRNLKLVLWFAPLAVLFIALGLAVNDMRHPSIQTDQCTIRAVGADVLAFQPLDSEYIYRQSSNPANEVGLQCSQMGALYLNDTHLFLYGIEVGQAVELSQKRYAWLPERWSVNVHVPLPNEEAGPNTSQNTRLQAQ